MTPYAVAETVGNALRTPNGFRSLVPVRPSLGRGINMNTSVSSARLWNPARGIVFASTSRAQSEPPSARPLSNAAVSLKDDTFVASGHKGGPAGDTELAKATSAPLYPDLSAALPDEPVEDEAEPATAPGAESAEFPEQNDPPYPALDWKMPEDLFRAAKKATPGTKESFWAYGLYRGPDGQQVKVHYCRSKHTMERVCQQYFLNEKVLGFDLEWMADAGRSSGIKRNISLIQLASPSRIGLFHVAVFPKKDYPYVAPTFKRIMENSNITKAGVWIRGDATKLRTHMRIDSKGLMELSHLYRLVTYSQNGRYQDINKRLIPLATQVQRYLHLPMFKGQDVRAGNWFKPLSMDQVIYAASDAYAGVQLFAVLDHHRKQLDPCPPLPHHAELELPIRLADDADLETDSDGEDEFDDPGEEEQPADPKAVARAARIRELKSFLQSAKETVQRLEKCVADAEVALLPKDPRVEAAETWAAAFKEENQPSPPDYASSGMKPPTGFAAPYELRAYHVWHTNRDLCVADVAKLLRNPPLKTSTVASYICCAVQKERLPVDQARWTREVVGNLPERMKRGLGRAKYP